MQVIADLDENRHAHLFSNIMCSQFSEPKTIHLIADTGSTSTTLLSDDVTRLAVNCNSLQRTSTPSLTASGSVTPYLLQNVDLTFRARYGWLNRTQGLAIFHLTNIQCMPPTQPQLMTHQRIQHACSLLGMDVLGHFQKWKFMERTLILKTK